MGQLEGSAVHSVQELALTEAKYAAAIDILKGRFGRKQQIVSGHIRSLAYPVALVILVCTSIHLSTLQIKVSSTPTSYNHTPNMRMHTIKAFFL